MELRVYKSFEILKKKLVKASILKFPNWLKKFHVHINASTIIFGEILTQPKDDNMDYPNSYTSQNLNKVKNTSSTTEQEGLGMIFSLQKFWDYLLDNPFIFYIDHQELKYLVNKPLHHGRICQWFLLFQDF